MGCGGKYQEATIYLLLDNNFTGNSNKKKKDKNTESIC